MRGESNARASGQMIMQILNPQNTHAKYRTRASKDQKRLKRCVSLNAWKPTQRGQEHAGTVKQVMANGNAKQEPRKRTRGTNPK